MAETTTTNPRTLRYRAANKARKEAKVKREAKPAKEIKNKEIAPVTREMTIYLHKYLHKAAFKKRAPKAIKVIRYIAMKTMKTSNVKFDMGLNKFIWNQGIRTVDHRVRVRLARLPVEGEENKFYTLVSYVPVDTFKGLLTKTVEAEN